MKKPAKQKEFVNDKGHQLALKESEERFRLVFENSHVGQSMTGIDGSLKVNKVFCNILGYTENELRDKSWQEITHPDDIGESQDVINSLLIGEKEFARYEKRYLKKNSEIVWTDVSTTIQRDTKGNPLYFITMMIDISDRKRADEQIRSFSKELEQKVKELDKAVTDLKRSNQELEQFAYVASHDLQEPLRMVSSYTQLLERRYKDKLDQDAIDFINFAVDGANRMQHLINDLLEFSRVTTKGKPMVKLDLSDVLGQAVANLHNKIQETGSMIVNDDLPFAYGDEGQLIRVFQNLLDNAMKFRGDESPRINITAKTIEDEVQISIADNGIGIDKIFSERVFTIFQRLHTKADYPGTGIGLAICKRTIERHGGKIWFESEPGNGTTFCFTLKIK